MTTATNKLPPARTMPAPFPSTRPAAKRFTLDGDAGLERHLARVCEDVLAGVQKIIPPRRFEALWLGGGYGRGEGGVLKTEAGDRPYNDLEFYVFVRGNRFSNERRYGGALHQLGAELTPAAGAEVELKIISAGRLRRSPPSMFYYDLVMGHRRLWGGEALAAGCAPHRVAGRIPPAEATRLLMNRGSGLLFAREKLERQPFTADDADFVGRNLAKAQLALGDAVLTAFGQYHWSCLERHARLAELRADAAMDWLPEVFRAHAAGVEFKLHPRRAPASAAGLQPRHEEITALALQVWLWLENRRLGPSFESARAYAFSPVNKCPDTNPWRNCLVNAKIFGWPVVLQPGARRHPRERILNVLAHLLWAGPPPDAWLRRELRLRNGDAENRLAAYRSLWRRLN